MYVKIRVGVPDLDLDPTKFSIRFHIQLNSCSSNSCNSKDHLNRTNSLVPSEYTLATWKKNKEKIFEAF